MPSLPLVRSRPAPTGVSLAHAILRAVDAWPEGELISADRLADLAPRPSVGRALGQLATHAKLIRVCPGIYVQPVIGRFGVRVPSSRLVAQSWARYHGVTVVSNPATAANSLGVSEQVPVKTVFLTSGRSRTLSVGATSIELRHAPAWQLLFPETIAGDVLRCLAWVGPQAAGTVLVRLATIIPATELDVLREPQRDLPKWLARTLRKNLA